ncbi:ParA family protein [Alicyclobacillus fodiniaquatilis]|uniref:ParA family protein n=1 Tax=Alicyclobacillus fodiniaquatilis TaxID=1661150 RepID=A0ABW4JI28_9BACL
MLLLLEPDRVRQAEALAAAERAGLKLSAVDHEEKLSTIDVTAVELVLVGADWPGVGQIQGLGFVCPFIYVGSSDDDAAYEKARQLRCVDVVTYPLSMDYLKRWIQEAEPEEKEPVSSTSMTPMEAILKRHRLPRPTIITAHTNEKDIPVGDPDPLLRGRVVVIHSARGGVGKSTLTALLARTLSRQRLAVGVIDLDPKGNLQAIHHQPAAMTADDFTRLPTQMDESAFKDSLVQVDDWYLLPSGRARNGLDETTLRRLIHPFCRYFDVVLIDTSPSATTTYTALELADRVVFTMTPEWMAFKRFLEEYELVRHMKTASHVVMAVNRIRVNVSEHRRVLRLLQEADVASDIVQIPEDRRLYRDVMTASPLTGSRKVSAGVVQVMDALHLLPRVDDARKRRTLREVFSR